MKIFIDTTFFNICEWEDGKRGDSLLTEKHATTFQNIVNRILTPSQLYKNATGNDIVYTLSKKKENILRQIIADRATQ